MTLRLGVDLGGTKIEAAVLGPTGEIVWRQRAATPARYADVVPTVVELVAGAESALATAVSVGVGIPGVISPVTRRVQTANVKQLVGHALDRDLEQALGRAVRIENDANCFALSEASDGAGAGARCVFGAILGTGCGGGVVVDGRVQAGRHRIAGEWGHMPLPQPQADEWPLIPCWCGQTGCIELYVAGPPLARSCDAPDVETVRARAEGGDPAAQAALDRHADRLARGLAVICNVLDPDVIVLGGGLSNMPHLYAQLPGLLRRYVFSDLIDTPVIPHAHGDSGGVRGAAWLWGG